jgi:hypothetical protein
VDTADDSIDFDDIPCVGKLTVELEDENMVVPLLILSDSFLKLSYDLRRSLLTSWSDSIQDELEEMQDREPKVYH